MSVKIRSHIIPTKSFFNGISDTWDYPAICIYAATGFFLDEDTYFQNLKVLKPATILHHNGKQEQYFKWHYSPRDLTLEQATEEFAHLFETIISEQVSNQRVILPLSGGLDSRTQAAALKHLRKEVRTYSYRFAGGHDETTYGKQIGQLCEFPFEDWEVPRGYLWDCIDQLSEINGCYSEFTHPRQMAFVDKFSLMGDIFSLGHWGDVLFDDMGVPDHLPFDLQVEVVINKILKKGGLELAESLWKNWDLPGSFEPFFRERVRKLMFEIDIPHSANARIRAFKSMYWAPRWTSVNLSIFESVRPITLPYYDNRMCKFICTLPEKHLVSRQIQIEYLKMRAPELARIPWQDHRPFNLYNYKFNKSPWNIPYRVYDKVKRTLHQVKGNQLIQRNWELQFWGNDNEIKVRDFVLKKLNHNRLISLDLAERYLNMFYCNDEYKYAHAISMLLTIINKRL